MPQPHKQLAIEEHMLLVCPHCWTAQQIADEYPELAKYPVSHRICDFHFQILLATALEVPVSRKEDVRATTGIASTLKRKGPGKATG